MINEKNITNQNNNHKLYINPIHKHTIIKIPNAYGTFGITAPNHTFCIAIDHLIYIKYKYKMLFTNIYILVSLNIPYKTRLIYKYR